MLGLLLIVVIFCLWNIEDLVYGIRLAKGQLEIVTDAVPIKEVLNYPQFPDSLKYKLKLIQEIKKFAVDSLGINPSENYSTFFDQQGKQIIWVVTASEPFSLTAYEWDFPIAGKFPYKGFFNPERAKKEEERLKKLGLDTDIGNASGWSTLGWFKDPVLSSMLGRSDGSLANLIIHELTHGTIYVKDSARYNENLASFIGDKGAILFLKNKYGVGSLELQQYQNNKQDKEKLIDHMLRGSEKLDSLYKSLENELLVDIKARKKQDLISTILSSADTLSLNRPEYKDWYIGTEPINNTFFMGFKRYNERLEDFEVELEEKFQGNLKEYLKYLKDKYPSL